MSDQQAGVVPTPPTGPQTLNVAGQTVRIQQVLAAAGTQNVNLLTTGGGQQFVITSGQVPGLAQVGHCIIIDNAMLSIVMPIVVLTSIMFLLGVISYRN